MIEPMSVCELDEGSPKYQVPEIPEDRRDQQRKHHGEARAAADLQDQLDRQQRNDPEGDGAGGDQHAEEIEQCRTRRPPGSAAGNGYR